MSYCAHPLPRILVPWDIWANLSWVSDFGPREAALRWRSERWRTVQDLPRAQGLTRSLLPPGSPEAKDAQRGRSGPRALAPLAWKMASPGH